MIRLSLERIARKLYLLRREGSISADTLLATPRFIEGLCFLQAFSELPGGIEKFTKSFLDASHDWWLSFRRPRCLPDETKEANELQRFDYFEELLCKYCESERFDGGRDLAADEMDMMFPGFLHELSNFMDEHARTELAKTADTSLRRTVNLELDFARTSSPPVPMVLVADTRHGKTTAVETYCRAWPGRARLVTIPESNLERELYAAYAEAFGMGVTPKTHTRDLKERVQFTLRNTGLFCVHDEAHWLVPIKYQKDTPPQRLNWVRTQIVDRHLPCAFFCTPQSQEETLARYVQKTHHNMEQWLGRMPKPVLISERPTYEDLMAVARVRFAEFPQVALDELCDAAVECNKGDATRLNGEGGFKIVELAGARAKFLAAQRESKVTLMDIQTAVEWAGAPAVAPKPATAQQSTDFPSSARGRLGRRGGAAAALPGPRGRSALADIGAPAVPA